MSSYSSGDGSMSLTITFKLGTDLDQAQVLVQNRVSIAEPRLPEEVRRLGITTTKSSPDLMMVVHMLSPDDTYDQLYVSNYARSRVRDVLLQARRRRRPDHLRRARIFAAHLARSGKAVRLRHDRGRRRAGAARAERAGVGRLDRRAADRRRQRVPVHGDHAGPLRRRARLPLCDRQVDRRRPADLAAGRRAHRARRQGLRHQFLSERQAGGGARPSSSGPAPMRSPRPTRSRTR